MTKQEKTARPENKKSKDQDIPLICPVCEQSLSWNERNCLCEQGHSFDMAKEGYVNLLLSHCRRSKHPGDSADMVKARRKFIDNGAFAQIAELIQSEVMQLLTDGEKANSFNIVDSGCGDGYFLGALQKLTTCPAYGIDVSKDAIRLAARKHKDSRWVVANAMRKMPFACDSINIILSVLAPRKVDEFDRILKKNGSLLIVVPGPNHLIELRSLLKADAGDFQEKSDEAVELCSSHFQVQNKRSLTYEVLLNRENLADLIQMTPLFWRSPRGAKANIEKLNELKVTMSFVLQRFSPTN